MVDKLAEVYYHIYTAAFLPYWSNLFVYRLVTNKSVSKIYSYGNRSI